MSAVFEPRWLIHYEGKDVTNDISRTVTSVEYTDHLKGKSDELSITVADREGRWREGWWPSAGDRLVVQFGYVGGALLNAGQFTIDEVELAGPPDTVSIRALATPVSGQLRDIVHRAYELTTLREIVTQLATALELELVGEVEALPVARVTQGESTLAFLRRLAEAYGYAFAIRPPRLVFFPIAQLEATPAAFALGRRDLSDYRLKAGVQNTYVACEVSWFDPKTKEKRTGRVLAADARERVLVSNGPSGGGAAPSVPSRLLQQGVTGEDVRAWQTFLTSKGFDSGAADGIFGPRTRGATIAFQRAHGLAVDGVAGPETFRVAVEQGYGTASASTSGARTEVAGLTLYKEIRVETTEQAEARARELLAAANRLKATGDLTLVRGDIRAVAGARMQLAGMGRMSGEYVVQKSKHSMSRGSGYVTSVEVSGV